MKTLVELNEKFQSDKGTKHDYLEAYEKHFSQFRLDRLNILEIGVAGGRSLKLWSNYFENAKICGIDKRKEYKGWRDNKEGQRIRTFYGNQNDSEFLESVCKEVGGFDIIIDDGSHLPYDQKISFKTLFPFLRDGGIYAIEDLMFSYNKKVKGGGYLNKDSMEELIKGLIDDIHRRYFKKKKMYSVAEVHHYYQLAIIVKSK